MQGQTKVEHPKQGDDIRTLGAFYDAVAKWINRPWEMKPFGKVISSGEKVVIDFSAAGIRVNVAVNGQPATVPLLKSGEVTPIV